MLATLAVKGRAPMTGYTRAQYGDAWTDDNDDPLGHNGCDTRDDILQRDLTGTTLDPASHGCVVLTGSLADPYTATTIAFVGATDTSTAIQIDHVVPLSDAWVTGAQQWTMQKRVDIGNDPLNLLAVSGPQNEKKGDGDAATWLPPNKSYRCAYVARQVAVKAKYQLWVTQAEHDAIATILATCPSQLAPTETSPVATTPATTPTLTTEAPATTPNTPAPAPAPTTAAEPSANTPTTAAAPGVVTPGAFCSASGATGVSKTGKAERCETSPTDTRLRWRAA